MDGCPATAGRAELPPSVAEVFVPPSPTAAFLAGIRRLAGHRAVEKVPRWHLPLRLPQFLLGWHTKASVVRETKASKGPPFSPARNTRPTTSTASRSPAKTPRSKSCPEPCRWWCEADRGAITLHRLKLDNWRSKTDQIQNRSSRIAG